MSRYRQHYMAHLPLALQPLGNQVLLRPVTIYPHTIVKDVTV